MDQHQNPEEATESGKDHLRAAAGDIREAVSAKVEDIRQATAEKTDKLREAAQGKVQELRGAVESAWSGARSAKCAEGCHAETIHPWLVPQPSKERVALRAYAIGERRRNLGIPGDETSDWVQAEQELLEESYQAKSWQAEGEAYIRDNPTKAVFIALGAGFVLGLLLRK